MADDKTFNSSDFLDDGDDDYSLLGGDPETDAILGKSDEGDAFSFDDSTPSIDLQPNKNASRKSNSPHNDQDSDSSVIDDSNEPGQEGAWDPSMVPKLTIQGQDEYTSLDDLEDDDVIPPHEERMEVPNLEDVKIPEPEPDPRRPKKSRRRESNIDPNNGGSSNETTMTDQYGTVPLSNPDDAVDYGQVDNVQNNRAADRPAESTPTVPSVIVEAGGNGSVIDVNLVRKIIFVIDNYRHLDKQSQNTVEQFIKAISYVKKNRKIDDLDEGDIVKEVIETDPDVRAGVHNLIDAKERSGADRAFFLMGLDSSSLKNINLFLRLTGTTKNEIAVEDESLASIKNAAEVLNDLLDKLTETQVTYIKKLDGILQSTEKVMKS